MKAKAFRLMATKITTKSGINFETISCITDFRIMLNRKNTEIKKMDFSNWIFFQYHAQNLGQNFKKYRLRFFTKDVSTKKIFRFSW